MTGIILAAGRIVGESAALLFTAGSARSLPRLGRNLAENVGRLLGKALESGGTLTVELYLQMQEGKYELAFSTGCVLIVLVLVINGAVKIIAGGLRRKR